MSKQRGEELVRQANQRNESDPERARLLQDAAWEYIFVGAFVPAHELLSRAVSLTESIQQAGPYREHASPRSERYAELLCDLGMMQWRLAKFVLAESSYEKALSIRLALFGDQHASVGEVWSGLAGLYRYQGRGVDAEVMIAKALTNQRNALGEDHPEYATSLRNQAAILRDLNLRRVEAICQRSISIFESAYGKGCLESLHVRKVLDYFYFMTNDERGKSTSEKTLELLINLLGPDHPLVAGSRLTLGRFLEKEDPVAARQLYREALQSYRDTFNEHPLVALAYSAVASCDSVLNHRGNTIPKRENALAIYSRFYEPPHPFVYPFVVELANDLLSAGRFDEAEKNYQQALAISRQQTPLPVLKIVTDLLRLADTHFQRRQLTEAERFALEALALFEDNQRTEKPFLESILGWLVSIYEAQGNIDARDRFNARLQEVTREISR